MKKQLLLILMSSLSLFGGVVLAQTSNDAERLRISKERAVLEAGFHRKDAACYQKFMVNNCLDEVKIRRQEALTDLRRQEISIDDQERKAKFLGDEELGCFAHERSWEAGELKQLLCSKESPAELLVKAFYVGRASAGRERPHARRMVSEALNECHRRYQKVAAEVFSQVMSSRGAE